MSFTNDTVDFVTLRIDLDNRPGSYRRVIIPVDSPLSHLHLVVCTVTGWSPHVFFEIQARYPKPPVVPGQPINFTYEREHHWVLPEAFNQDWCMEPVEYVGDGIISEGWWPPFGSESEGRFLWSKDSRTYSIRDAFKPRPLDDHSPTDLWFDYTANRAASATIVIEQVHTVEQDPFSEEDITPMVVEVEGGGWDPYENCNTRKPRINNLQSKLNKMFEEMEPGSTNRNKCSMCKAMREECELPLGQGCQMNSGDPCCRFCPANQAFSDLPLDEEVLKARVLQLGVEAKTEYESR